MKEFIYKNNQKLHYGFTTGAAAAAAAKAAALMLFSGISLDKINLLTPKGFLLELPVSNITIAPDYAECSIKKDAGDDPDITDGIEIFANVSKPHTNCTGPSNNSSIQVLIQAGTGIGKVTKPGLQQPVGEAAINQVPRAMITKEVTEICIQQGYTGPIQVTISAPKGAELAKQTFNGRLGIQGGISILGTTGIVEPMSESAIMETTHLELKQLRESGFSYVIITPGNYGETFLSDGLNLSTRQSVKCSNFIGDALDYAAALGFTGVLLIGHIGKFVKLAGGIFNTHSKTADARMEIFTALAAACNPIDKEPDKNLNRDDFRSILSCNTTDEVITLLDKWGIRDPVMAELSNRITYYLNQRIAVYPTKNRKFKAEAFYFSNQHGLLGKTANAQWILKKIQQERNKQ